MLKNLLVLLVIGVLANYGWSRYKAARDVDAYAAAQAGAVPGSADARRAATQSPALTVASAASDARCDGRTRCPQMTSCAEATYFIRHCPNTEMDGNHDGVPFEQQWCERED